MAFDGIPEEIRVFSHSGNLRGLYTRDRSELPEGVDGPLYRHRRGKSAKGNEVYLTRRAGCWALAPQIDCQRVYCTSQPVDTVDPTKIGEQPASWTDTISRIEAVHHDEVHGKTAPDRLECHSHFNNLSCGMRRKSKDELIWASDAGDLFMWHCSINGIDADEWHVTDGPPDEYQKIMEKVPALGSEDPRAADWASVKGIDSVSSVWWKDQEDAGWIDPEFPHRLPIWDPNDEQDVEWIRGPYLNRDPMHEHLFEKIDPEHVKQGSLGDCWLLAAIAVAAEFPHVIEQLFTSGKHHPAVRSSGCVNVPAGGKMEIRLFDVHTDSWSSILIDDYIPCKPRKWYEEHAEPIFAKPVGSELWVLYLEKAFAKFFGGYGNLDSNNPCIAWQIITGSEEQVMFKKRKSGGWDQLDADVDEQKMHWQKSDRHEIGFAGVVGTAGMPSKDLWKQLSHASDNKQCLMACSFDGPETDGEQVAQENGLVATHVYSIIRVCTARRHTDNKLHLLELRNPWGNSIEWNGPWSDSDSAWKENPDVARELDFKDADDGSFWMLFEDFEQEFTDVFLCPDRKGGVVQSQSLRDIMGQETPRNRMATDESEGDGEHWEGEGMAGSKSENERQLNASFRLAAERQNGTPHTGPASTFEVETSQSGRSRMNEGSCVDKCTQGCTIM